MYKFFYLSVLNLNNNSKKIFKLGTKIAPHRHNLKILLPQQVILLAIPYKFITNIQSMDILNCITTLLQYLNFYNNLYTSLELILQHNRHWFFIYLYQNLQQGQNVEQIFYYIKKQSPYFNIILILIKEGNSLSQSLNFVKNLLQIQHTQSALKFLLKPLLMLMFFTIMAIFFHEYVYFYLIDMQNNLTDNKVEFISWLCYTNLKYLLIILSMLLIFKNLRVYSFLYNRLFFINTPLFFIQIWLLNLQNKAVYRVLLNMLQQLLQKTRLNSFLVNLLQHLLEFSTLKKSKYLKKYKFLWQILKLGLHNNNLEQSLIFLENHYKYKQIKQKNLILNLTYGILTILSSLSLFAIFYYNFIPIYKAIGNLNLS